MSDIKTTWPKTHSEMILYYRKNPDRFIDDFIGVNLRWYQKMILKLIMKDGFHSDKTRPHEVGWLTEELR